MHVQSLILFVECSPGLVTIHGSEDSTTQKMDIENGNSAERVALSCRGKFFQLELNDNVRLCFHDDVIQLKELLLWLLHWFLWSSLDQ